ncbi:MAG: GcrA cell cycle regulator, partial [Alphaproteobacteria bacterium]|nr:GcrA cell cycle regulator [Alphaproteobacteria bacterium]
MAWTTDMIDNLKKLWKKGLTTNEIAKELGVSKNSIVGKVHRLNLTSRPSPIKKKDDETEVEVQSQETLTDVAPEKVQKKAVK